MIGAFHCKNKIKTFTNIFSVQKEVMFSTFNFMPLNKVESGRDHQLECSSFTVLTCYITPQFSLRQGCVRRVRSKQHNFEPSNFPGLGV